MERKIITTEEDPIIRWKKIGGGIHTFNGRYIKPGQIFSARASQISKNFRDVIIPIDELPPPPEDAPVKLKEAEYKAVSRGVSKTWFNVVNLNAVDEDGNPKVINEKALTKDAAEKLVYDLSKAK